MAIYTINNKQPQIHPTAFIAENATITGDVIIGAYCSIWYGVVIRGDVAPVSIGERVNIQDNSVLHQSTNIPLIIEDDITIGHLCLLHSCIIRKQSLIGMGSTILDNCEIETGSYIGAGSLVAGGKTIPANMLCYGRPAKVIRQTNAKEQLEIKNNVLHYINQAQIYIKK